MKRTLQPRGFRESPYERPDQPWVCGAARDGQPCVDGPSRAGRCVTTHDCVPTRVGNRFACGRPETHGGPCSQGPLPDGGCARPVTACQPRRSLHGRRRRATRWALGTACASLALALTGADGVRVFSPGPLSAPHGGLDQDCGACHPAVGDGPYGWIAAGLIDPPAQGQDDALRCATCHDLGTSGRMVHGLLDDELRARTPDASIRAAGEIANASVPVALRLARLASMTTHGDDRVVACASCHKEHRGHDADLTTLADAQCQSCHTLQFASLASGHPDLGDYPHAERSAIRFDHVTHAIKHFPDDERELRCADCHVPDTAGEQMTVASFETACASCHEADVRGDGLKRAKRGITFLSLPSLDLDALRQPGLLPLGTWPKTRRSPPSPFVDLLVSPDPRLEPDDLAVVERLDLGDLESVSDTEKDAVIRYAWAIKQLLHDFETTGAEALADRLEAIRGQRPDESERGQLSGLLPFDVVAALQREQVPGLEAEVAAYVDAAGFEPLSSQRAPMLRSSLESATTASPSPGDPRSDRNREKFARSGGWYTTARDGALRYRSCGHADPFLKGWLDVAAALSSDRHIAAASQGAAARLLAALQKDKAPGRCLGCHSVSSNDGALRIGWRADPRPDPTATATRFRHAPHFSVDPRDPCTTCHVLAELPWDEARETFAAAYATPDEPPARNPNFAPVEASLCADCHRSELAGDACVDCHVYHLGGSRPVHQTAAR